MNLGISKSQEILKQSSSKIEENIMTFKLKIDHLKGKVVGFGNREGLDLMTMNELC